MAWRQHLSIVVLWVVWAVCVTGAIVGALWVAWQELAGGRM